MIFWSSRNYLSTWQTGSSLSGSVVKRENPSKMNSCSSWWMIVGCWRGKNAKSSLSNLKVNKHWVLSINRVIFCVQASFGLHNICFLTFLPYQTCLTNTCFTKIVLLIPFLPSLFLTNLFYQFILPKLFFLVRLPSLFY